MIPQIVRMKNVNEVEREPGQSFGAPERRLSSRNEGRRPAG